MPRDKREVSTLGIHHTILKGHNNDAIFADPRSKKRFLELIKLLKEKYDFKLLCYCIMDNHVHLVFKEKKQGDVSAIMKSLELRFTIWYHRQFGGCGTIFKGRFMSRAVNNYTYFKNVVRYVHRNPVNAKLCNHPNEYSDSSYHCFFGDDSGLIDRDFVFEHINEVIFDDFHSDSKAADIELKSGVFMMVNDNLFTSLPDEKAENEMCRLSRCQGGEDFQQLEPERRQRLIVKFRRIGCSYTQIAAFIMRSNGAVYYWINRKRAKRAKTVKSAA